MTDPFHPFKPGQRALVIGKHPHTGRTCTLLSYGPYGLKILGLVGWYCRGDDGLEFNAKTANLQAL